MKKWYVITGILALLLIISMSTCSSNSAEVDRVKEKFADAKAQLADITEELEKIRSSFAQLKATKEINFGNSLRIFDIEKGYYEVRDERAREVAANIPSMIEAPAEAGTIIKMPA